jgi:hypothetical protein
MATERCDFCGEVWDDETYEKYILPDAREPCNCALMRKIRELEKKSNPYENTRTTSST